MTTRLLTQRLVFIFAVLLNAALLNLEFLYSANAEDTTFSMRDIGVSAGLAFVGNGNGTKLNLGAQFNHKIQNNFGLGLYFDYVALGSVQFPGTTLNYSNYLTHILARGNYYLTSVIDGLAIGIDVGPQLFVTNVPGASNSTDLTYGAHATYDYQLQNNISVGPEASIFLTTQTQGATIFNLVAVAKYHF